MTPIDLLGWFAAALGMASTLPQLVRLFRVRCTQGLSLSLFQLNAAASGAWAFHGFLVAQPQLQWPNLVVLVLSLAVVAMITRDRQESFWAKQIVPAAVVVALIGVDLWLGPVVFGVLVALPYAIGVLSQLRSMHRSENLAGVSPVYLFVLFLVEALWLTWGVLVWELAITVSAATMGTLCAATFGYWLYRRRWSSRRCQPLAEAPRETADIGGRA
ncbi:MAG: PQ-loop repeat-containing protein [Propionibacteriaceae bacterium]|nr:PQ-loop repeat-containing protein [Propionibacteriaceae bacterium]